VVQKASSIQLQVGALFIGGPQVFVVLCVYVDIALIGVEYLCTQFVGSGYGFQ
jgi:hypothetical protein